MDAYLILQERSKMVNITLTEDQINDIIKSVDANLASVSAITMLIEETGKSLVRAESELSRLKASSEKDSEFNDPRTVTPENPTGTFSPMSTVNRQKAIEEAQSIRDTAYIRHEWAKKKV